MSAHKRKNMTPIVESLDRRELLSVTPLGIHASPEPVHVEAKRSAKAQKVAIDGTQNSYNTDVGTGLLTIYFNLDGASPQLGAFTGTLNVSSTDTVSLPKLQGSGTLVFASGTLNFFVTEKASPYVASQLLQTGYKGKLIAEGGTGAFTRASGTLKLAITNTTDFRASGKLRY
jgi:hypothetical protein